MRLWRIGRRRRRLLLVRIVGLRAVLGRRWRRSSRHWLLARIEVAVGLTHGDYLKDGTKLDVGEVNKQARSILTEDRAREVEK